MRLFRVFGSPLLATVTAIAILAVAVGSFSTAQATRRTVYDFSGGIHTDFVTFSAPTLTGPLTWKVLRNPASPGPGNAFIRVFEFGLGGDSITAADRIGDSKFDISVWRSGVYYSHEFPESTAPFGPLTVVQWGIATDGVACDGDYDGDGKDDYTVIRTISSQFNWFSKTATPANDRNTPFGANSAGQSLFRFQGADFTGDGREEFVLASVANAGFAVTWLIGDSLTGALLHVIHWGNFNSGILIQPDDYTGDGIADIVVWTFTDGGWWIRNTATGATVPPVRFGIPDPNFMVNDVPCRGDYDGDNIADRAVFRPSTREFFWINSSNGAIGGQQWGDVGDTALATLFVF